MYQLIISDNGKGMPKEKKSDGIGLVNMKERVALLKGNIRFQTENGFRIFIMIPKENCLKGDTDL